jgi:Fe-S-cluster-containing dehydrogenase component
MVTGNLEIDSALCTVCRACEVACHFHHTRTFGASATSVEIRYNAANGDVEILFLGSCDGCTQETGPFCARFCAPGAIRTG